MAEDTFVLEGEVITREGVQHVGVVVWDDYASVSTNGGTEAYINGSSDTANLLAGTSVATGNTYTLPTLTIPVGSGGVTIVVEPSIDAAGLAKKTGIIYRVLKPGTQR